MNTTSTTIRTDLDDPHSSVETLGTGFSCSLLSEQELSLNNNKQRFQQLLREKEHALHVALEDVRQLRSEIESLKQSETWYCAALREQQNNQLQCLQHHYAQQRRQYQQNQRLQRECLTLYARCGELERELQLALLQVDNCNKEKPLEWENSFLAEQQQLIELLRHQKHALMEEMQELMQQKDAKLLTLQVNLAHKALEQQKCKELTEIHAKERQEYQSTLSKLRQQLNFQQKLLKEKELHIEKLQQQFQQNLSAQTSENKDEVKRLSAIYIDEIDAESKEMKQLRKELWRLENSVEDFSEKNRLHDEYANLCKIYEKISCELQAKENDVEWREGKANQIIKELRTHLREYAHSMEIVFKRINELENAEQIECHGDENTVLLSKQTILEATAMVTKVLDQEVKTELDKESTNMSNQLFQIKEVEEEVDEDSVKIKETRMNSLKLQKEMFGFEESDEDDNFGNEIMVEHIMKKPANELQEMIEYRMHSNNIFKLEDILDEELVHKNLFQIEETDEEEDENSANPVSKKCNENESGDEKKVSENEELNKSNKLEKNDNSSKLNETNSDEEIETDIEEDLEDDEISNIAEDTYNEEHNKNVEKEKKENVDEFLMRVRSTSRKPTEKKEIEQEFSLEPKTSEVNDISSLEKENILSNDEISKNKNSKEKFSVKTETLHPEDDLTSIEDFSKDEEEAYEELKFEKILKKEQKTAKIRYFSSKENEEELLVNISSMENLFKGEEKSIINDYESIDDKSNGGKICKNNKTVLYEENFKLETDAKTEKKDIKEKENQMLNKNVEQSFEINEDKEICSKISNIQTKEQKFEHEEIEQLPKDKESDEKDMEKKVEQEKNEKRAYARKIARENILKAAKFIKIDRIRNNKDNEKNMIKDNSNKETRILDEEEQNNMKVLQQVQADFQLLEQQLNNTQTLAEQQHGQLKQSRTELERLNELFAKQNELLAATHVQLVSGEAKQQQIIEEVQTLRTHLQQNVEQTTNTDTILEQQKQVYELKLQLQKLEQEREAHITQMQNLERELGKHKRRALLIPDTTNANEPNKSAALDAQIADRLRILAKVLDAEQKRKMQHYDVHIRSLLSNIKGLKKSLRLAEKRAAAQRQTADYEASLKHLHQELDEMKRKYTESQELIKVMFFFLNYTYTYTIYTTCC